MRIIPITITIALLFLTVKLLDLMQGSESFVAPVEAASEEAKKEEKKEEKKPEGEKKAEGEHAEGGEEKKEAPACVPAKKDEKVSKEKGDTTDYHFSAAEVDLLKNLAARREELERWETNIEIKESALNATEKRINDKIGQIESMKKEVAELLSQYNTQEDAKIRSLVKIYENMKPKDAARIFDEVEMPILLLVIDKMSEKKAAPVLAEMDSRKAKQITVELAEQRRLNTAKVSIPTSAVVAPPPSVVPPAPAPAAASP